MAEITRQVNRLEPDSREKLNKAVPPAEDATSETVGDPIAQHFRAYLKRRQDKCLEPETPLKDFLLLCQTASFMARGRER